MDNKNISKDFFKVRMEQKLKEKEKENEELKRKLEELTKKDYTDNNDTSSVEMGKEEDKTDEESTENEENKKNIKQNNIEKKDEKENKSKENCDISIKEISEKTSEIHKIVHDIYNNSIPDEVKQKNYKENWNKIIIEMDKTHNEFLPKLEEYATKCSDNINGTFMQIINKLKNVNNLLMSISDLNISFNEKIAKEKDLNDEKNKIEELIDSNKKTNSKFNSKDENDSKGKENSILINFFKGKNNLPILFLSIINFILVVKILLI